MAAVIGFVWILKWLGHRGEAKISSHKNLHLLRRVYHVGCGLIMFALLMVVPYDLAVYSNAGGVLFVLVCHILRKNSPYLNQIYMNRVRFLLREHEIDSLPASFHFLLGILIAVAFFGERITSLSILILTFGDPVASLVGIYFGGRKITKDKSLSGTLACGLVSALSAIVCHQKVSFLDEVREVVPLPVFALAGFFIGIASELGYSNRDIFLDDNLTIPVYASVL